MKVCCKFQVFGCSSREMVGRSDGRTVERLHMAPKQEYIAFGPFHFLNEYTMQSGQINNGFVN